MPFRPDDESNARKSFLEVYAKDLEHRSIRSLEAYQELHPGFEDAIAEEFACLEDEGEATNTENPSESESVEGERLAGYRILRELGRGGQATVYLAMDEALGREVALKVLSAHVGIDEESAEFVRFRREAESAARLDHPSICTVYKTGEEDGLAYIAMRYVRGDTLARKIHRCREEMEVDVGAHMLTLVDGRGTMTRAHTATDQGLHVILQLIERCARALHEAHQQGLVHRDIKPGNIMVQEDGQPVLLDFGIATLESSDHSLTGSGVQIGTPYYMAPEQVRGQPADRRSDIYALGVTLYECLTLRRPFEASSREALYHQILDAQAVPVRSLNPRIATDLQVVIETAMDMDPSRRYQTALALAEDLECLRKFEPILARPIGPWLRFRRWTQRHPVRSAVMAVATLALVVSLLFWFRAENALADWGRLADLRRIQDLTVAADLQLWPVDSRKSEEMRTWLQEADRVLAHRKIHEERLRRLRTMALDYTEADRQRDQELPGDGHALRKLKAGISALNDHIEAIRKAQADHPALTQLIQQRDGLVQQAVLQEKRFDKTHRWRFADADNRWQHDVLMDLLQKIDELQILRSDVASRLKRATELKAQSLERSRKESWQRARAAIRSDHAYGGLDLPVQRGLLPLRQDPDSRLYEFAHLASGTAPAEDAAGHYILTPETALILVLLPGGSFEMGTPRGSLDGISGVRVWDNELPVTRVTLAPFFLSKYEMTQAQWQRIAGINPSAYQAPRAPKGKLITGRHPVENIVQDQARDMLRRLGLLLPTEAQWEYAARAGTSSAWWTGNDPKSLQGTANLADRAFGNRPFETWLDDGYACHAPVGSYRPNDFGLHDMAGNVWEWVQDGYANYSTDARARDGLRASWEMGRGMRRGGSWMSMVNELRSARRLYAEHSYRNGTVGVRPARSLDQVGR